jgi:hypothetical protein
MPEVVLAALEHQANATATAAATSITRVDVTGVRLSLEALQRLGDVAHRLQAIRISDRQRRGSAMAAVFPIDRSLRIQHQEELSSMLSRAIRHPQSRLAIVCVDYNSVVPCATVRALADQLQVLYARRVLPSLLGEDFPPWWTGRRLDYAYNGIFYILEAEEQGLDTEDVDSDEDVDSIGDDEGEEDDVVEEEDAADEDAADEDAADEDAADEDAADEDAADEDAADEDASEGDAAEEDAAEEDAADEDAAEEDAADEDAADEDAADEDAADEDAADEDAAEEGAAEEGAAASVGEKRKLEPTINDHSKKPKHSSHSDDID